MSGKERVIAALLLAIAVAGGAVIPRLLGAAPSAPLGIALGPGPSRSVVQAPSIPKPPSHGSARPNSSPQNAVRPSPVVSSVPAPTTPQSSTPSTKPPTHPSPPPYSPPPPSPPPPSPPPPTTTPTQPPALMPQAPTRPGHGYGDKNHTHTGPPGHADRPATATKPTRRSHGADVPGSEHGRPSTQAPSHPVGHHHRRVGRVAPPASGAAAHAHEARPEARTKARGPRGKGRRGTHPPQQVTPGNSTHDSPPPAAPAAPITGNNGHRQSGQGNGQANGHQGHGKDQAG